MDVKALRTEIKAWEHAFKKGNGRDPTIDDIKSQTNIAEKYRLYKKLSKLPITTNSATYSDTNTSTRSSSISRSPSHLLPKKPAARSHYPPSEANPFSPPKKGTDLNSASGSTSSYILSSPNPFSTPVKTRPTNGALFDQDYSLIPFLPASTSQQSSLKSSTISHNAIINKARKRLHGDPVTPSPQKEKKRRLTKTREVKDEGDDDTTTNADTSFIEESPVKRPNGSKNFQSLFEDPIQSHVRRPLGVPFVFPSKLEYSNELVMRMPVADKRDSNRATTTSSRRTLEEPDDNSTSDADIETVADANSKQSGQSNKRVISSDNPDDLLQYNSPSAKHLNLIPPSPPPPDTTTTESLRAGLHRKSSKIASKLLDEDSHDDDETNVVEWRPPWASRRDIKSESDDTDLDVELQIQQKPTDYYTAPDEMSENKETENQVEIDLPEDLRNMLAISPSSHHREEKALVKHILYGQNSRRLNSKGGEVWDVGEIDTSGDEDEDEDDWAGEGVPWEVADM